MKYLVLIHDNAAVRELFAGMTDDERRAAFQVYWDVEAALRTSGELVDSKALDTGAQRYVRRTEGAPLVTDATSRIMLCNSPVMKGLLRRSWPMVDPAPWPQMKPTSSPSGSSFSVIDLIRVS